MPHAARAPRRRRARAPARPARRPTGRVDRRPPLLRLRRDVLVQVAGSEHGDGRRQADRARRHRLQRLVGCDTSCLLHLRARGEHEGVDRFAPATWRTVVADAIRERQASPTRGSRGGSRARPRGGRPCAPARRRRPADDRLQRSLGAQPSCASPTGGPRPSPPSTMRPGCGRRRGRSATTSTPTWPARSSASPSGRSPTAPTSTGPADAADANRYIVELARRIQARSVVKGKSMATEETELNEALEAAGLRRGRDRPRRVDHPARRPDAVHIIAPAVHLDRTQVRRHLRRSRAGGDAADVEPEELAPSPGRSCARSSSPPTSASPAATSAWPRPARSCSSTNEGNGRCHHAAPRARRGHGHGAGRRDVGPARPVARRCCPLGHRPGTHHLHELITGPRRAGEADGPTSSTS